MTFVCHACGGRHPVLPLRVRHACESYFESEEIPAFAGMTEESGMTEKPGMTEESGMTEKSGMTEESGIQLYNNIFI